MSIILQTNIGDITLELFCEKAPNSAKNFLALAASGDYDGTIFHRNVAGFIIQGGDPSGTGKEGLNFQGKLQADEIVHELKHDRRGVVGLSNMNKPDTVGSQFFITYGPQPHLDGVYSVFGRVVDGWEVVDKMEKVEVGKKHRPVEEIKILKVKVLRNPIAEAEA
jgi:peptidyl-prolyl cis-trans isomerase-like 3